MNDSSQRLENLILKIHHRNGGSPVRLDWQGRLLDPRLALDSLDLAEIFVAVEKEFGFSPFNTGSPPKTWADVAGQIKTHQANDRTLKIRNRVRQSRSGNGADVA